jgi:hypothetical protein
MMIELIPIGAAVAISIWLGLETWRMLRRKRHRFKERLALPVTSVRALFPATHLSAVEFEDFLNFVARATEVPLQLLRPGDRFDVELKGEKGWEFDDGVGRLPEAIKKRFGGNIEDYDLRRTRDLSGLLRAVDETLYCNKT